ncbi:ATP-binding protein [Olsenella urininfantis]|uniref:ATP-binding protein n=1 Tax=Olsenella urininfantis TaxID=1871033 RepID=UPI000987254D|nr:ATP-binding protein [Olsenella urininfantis]
MQDKTVRLSIPAEASYARAVRMMAANLAVLCDMSVDDVEDVRMAAEEGFVFSCATMPETCEVSFELVDDGIDMDFLLGDAHDDEIEAGSVDISLIELLLSAVCDDFDVTEEGYLHLVMRAGKAHA